MRTCAPRSRADQLRSEQEFLAPEFQRLEAATAEVAATGRWDAVNERIKNLAASPGLHGSRDSSPKERFSLRFRVPLLRLNARFHSSLMPVLLSSVNMRKISLTHSTSSIGPGTRITRSVVILLRSPGTPSSSTKNGLLLLAFSRALRRLAAKSRRFEPVGGAIELSSRAVDYDWSRQIDARLDLENILRKLSERNSTILALRVAGYNWEEVAQLLGTSVARVRNSFWREMRNIKRKLRVDGSERHRNAHPIS
jgi:hypothetical protein